jgi:hypothetical protein
MLLLTSTSDVVRVITGSALTVDVHASWVDNAAGTITPGRTNTAITTATTTTVVGAPAASTQRNVQTLNIHNKDISSNVIAVEHFDGTTAAELVSYSLAADETLQYIDGEGWRVINATGQIRTEIAAGGAVGSISAGTTRATLGEVVFSNSNGLSFGVNGQTVTGSYTVPSIAGLLSNINLSAGTTSNLGSAFTFSNSNGVSFGLNASTITASIATSLTNMRLSAGTTSNLRSDFTFSNSNGISFGLDNGTITGSHNALTSQSNQALSGSNGSFTFQTATFGNSNGLSFYTTNGSMVGSYTVPSVPAQSNQTLGIYVVSNTFGESSSLTYDARSLSLQLDGLSGGWSNGSLRLSVPAGGGGLTNIKLSAGTTSNLGSAFTFSNSNGVSFGLNASTITASIATSLTNMRLSAGTTSNLRSDFTFSNSNGISFGLDNGTITGSVATSLTNIRVSAGTTSNLLSAITFSNSNGITFGLNASTLTASHNGITSQTNQTLGLYAVSNTTGASSSSTFDARTISFHGAGIASVGYSGGSVVISVPSGGGGLTNINVSAGTTSQNLSNVVFSNSNGVSFGLNGSTITASVAAGGGGGVTISYFPNFPILGTRGVAAGNNASIHLVPFDIPAHLHMDRFVIPISVAISSSSNSSHGGTISLSAGVYTKNASTLSLVTSASQTYAWTNTSNNSNSVLEGWRLLTIPLTTTLSQGHYVIALWSQTSTANTNWFTASKFRVNSGGNQNFSGLFMAANNTTIQFMRGFGMYSASVTTAMPGSIAYSHITHQIANNVGWQWEPFYMISGTV